MKQMCGICRGIRPTVFGITSNFNFAAAALVALATLIPAPAAFAGDLDKVVLFNIEAQSLDKALLQFGAQAHVQISFEAAVGLSSSREEKLKGDFKVRDALSRLLSGTALSFVEHGNTVAIVSYTAPGSAGKSVVSGRLDPPISRAPDTQEETSATQSSAGATKQRKAVPLLEEVTVTGTHIRGAPPQSVPLLVFTRAAIDDSGYPTLQQFMASVPQNFAAVGSGTEGTPQNGLAGNQAFGSGVDLLGLGPESTLVLVNGHRLAPAGIGGSFTDVSLIPLNAIQRIEIEPAGASAIYGADAVGGVVNYVLRNPGSTMAETTLEYGGVTRGGLKDRRATQMFGTDWSSGSAMLLSDFNDESPLAARDRSYSQRSLTEDLVPETRQYGMLGHITQGVAGNLRLSSDAFYADRHSSSPGSAVLGGPLSSEEAETREYQIGVEIRGAAFDTWTWHSRASVSGNTTRLGGTEGAPPVAYGNRGDSRLENVDLGASGALGKLFGQSVLVATGLQVRDERIASKFTGANSVNVAIDRGRTVDSGFVEAKIPLLPAVQEGPISGPPRAELDLAARYDHYTDFGSTWNPNAGVAIWPLPGVRFRASWSSSFSAPQLWQLYGGQYSILLNSPDPRSASGISPVLLLIGTNPKLRPEKSDQWTTGIDFTPGYAKGVEYRLSYYRIDYADRIATPNIPVLDALAAGSDYADFVQRNPGPAELGVFSSAPYVFQNDTTIPGFGPPGVVSDAVAIADDRIGNIGRTFTDGLNVEVHYDGNAGRYRLNASLDGAYVFAFRESPLPATSPVELLDTLYNPVNLRVRSTLGESRGPESVHVSVNYDNHYSSLPSWTTVDFVARYRLFSTLRPQADVPQVTVSLACTNCFDRPPPGLTSILDSAHLGYDPTNASPLGTFISLTLTADW